MNTVLSSLINTAGGLKYFQKNREFAISYDLRATSYELWNTRYELRAKICDMPNPARAGWWQYDTGPGP